MEKEYIYVETTLRKLKEDGDYTVEKVEKYTTGINDPKRLILYKKLHNENLGFTKAEYKLWKGEKYGDRLGFDTSKQIGESYVEKPNYSYRDEIYVYELYDRA